MRLYGEKSAREIQQQRDDAKKKNIEKEVKYSEYETCPQSMAVMSA